MLREICYFVRRAWCALTVRPLFSWRRLVLYARGVEYGRDVCMEANATIDGNRAALIDLTYSKGEVDSRAYFAVKGNKMYYIFLTWYRPQANAYVPVFEKMVASLKIK